MNSKAELLSFAKDRLISLTFVLCGSYLLSLFAGYYWLFDLFSHFMVQYAVGGIVLAFLLAVLKSYKMSFLAVAISVLSFANIYPYQNWNNSKCGSCQSAMTLVQYNHNIAKVDFADVRSWIENNATNFDLIVLQEASYHTSQMAYSLKTLYPYQIHEEDRKHAFGMVILSRYPFLGSEITELNGPVFENTLVKLSIDTPHLDAPFNLYALHALPPMSGQNFAQRNYELNETASLIAAENHKYAAMVGDWNISPYSPYFKKILDTSGLYYQSGSFFLNPTWPSFSKFDFLQIPIDHVLYSDALIQKEKITSENFGSDHKALIVQFYKKSNDQ